MYVKETKNRNLCHGHQCMPTHAMGTPAVVTIVATVYREKTFPRTGRIFLIILAMRGVVHVTYREQQVRFAVVSMHGAVMNPVKEVTDREVIAVLLWVVTELRKNATEGIFIHTQANSRRRAEPAWFFWFSSWLVWSRAQ